MLPFAMLRMRATLYSHLCYLQNFLQIPPPPLQRRDAHGRGVQPLIQAGDVAPQPPHDAEAVGERAAQHLQLRGGLEKGVAARGDLAQQLQLDGVLFEPCVRCVCVVCCLFWQCVQAALKKESLHGGGGCLHQAPTRQHTPPARCLAKALTNSRVSLD